jgi:4-hydroxyphenylpyruvate dioxygenase-like putative hemolysin
VNSDLDKSLNYLVRLGRILKKWSPEEELLRFFTQGEDPKISCEFIQRFAGGNFAANHDSCLRQVALSKFANALMARARDRYKELAGQR